MDTGSGPSTLPMPHRLPRVAITYCTQCKWLLRAAYFGQELLSTFGTTIGEVALIPATGGLFQVHLTYKPLAPITSASSASSASESGTGDREDVQVQEVLLWDRKTEGGFPETKVLKQRVRNYVEPERDLGHSDVGGKKKKDEQKRAETDGAKDRAKEEKQTEEQGKENVEEISTGKDNCEDCK